mgnify:CR=1 FL=1
MRQQEDSSEADRRGGRDDGGDVLCQRDVPEVFLNVEGVLCPQTEFLAQLEERWNEHETDDLVVVSDLFDTYFSEPLLEA